MLVMACGSGSRMPPRIPDFDEFEEEEEDEVEVRSPNRGVDGNSQTESQVITTGKRKKPDRRSDVWKTFEIVSITQPDGSIKEMGVCKFCKAKYTIGSKGGTSHMRRHIPQYAKSHGSASDPRQTTLNFSPTEGNLTSWSYDPNRARELHAKYIAQTQLPLSIGDSHTFEEYIQNAYNPQFKRVYRNTARADCIKGFNEMRVKLINEFNTCTATVACTSDIWSSRTKSGYLCVTARYVDRSRSFQERLIAFKQIMFSHDANVITIMDVFLLLLFLRN